MEASSFSIADVTLFMKTRKKKKKKNNFGVDEINGLSDNVTRPHARRSHTAHQPQVSRAFTWSSVQEDLCAAAAVAAAAVERQGLKLNFRAGAETTQACVLLLPPCPRWRGEERGDADGESFRFQPDQVEPTTTPGCVRRLKVRGAATPPVSVVSCSHLVLFSHYYYYYSRTSCVTVLGSNPSPDQCRHCMPGSDGQRRRSGGDGYDAEGRL